MKQLSFGTGRGKEHALHSPFLKLGAAMLTSLSLACPHEDVTKTAPATSLKPAAVAQIVAGKYKCSPAQFVKGIPPPALMPTAFYMTLSDKNGSLFMTEQLGAGPTIPLKRAADGFTFINKSGQLTQSGTGQFLADGSLRISTTSASRFYQFTQINRCRCVKRQQPAAPADKMMRAVFIRPDTAQYQFYNSFGGPGKNAVTVSGTLKSSAQDLLNSGVTDIFIGFKTDFPWSAGGHSGDLLFDSKEGGYEDAGSLSARQNGFDPMGAFMTACQTAYAAAGKKVRFHAWFPVFKDEYAVRFGFQTGNANSGFVENIIDAVSDILTGKNYDCQSRIAAEPSNPIVVRFELTALEELMASYPLLSGINLDYIRYSLAQDPCYEGGDVKKTIEPHIWNVNPDAIEDFVKKVRAEFPNAVLSADVFADAQMRVDVGQAGILRYLDVIMPMAYTYLPTGTTTDLKTWISTIKQGFPTKTLMPILRGWSDGLPNPTPAGLISNLTSDLAAVKTTKADGYAVFTYEYLLRNSGNSKLSAIKAKLGY